MSAPRERDSVGGRFSRSALPLARVRAPDLKDQLSLSYIRGFSSDSLLFLQRAAGNSAVSKALYAVDGNASTPSDGKRGRYAAQVQRSIWDDVRGAAGSLIGGVRSVASEVAGGVTSAVGVLSGVAEEAVTALEAAGSDVVSWVASAGSSVVTAVKWFGAKAASIITALGRSAFEKLSLLGTEAWSLIINAPKRLWRELVDGFEAVKGVIDWLGTGLSGAVAELWDAVLGVWSWLGTGAEGILGWLKGAVAAEVDWVIDFFRHPSLDAVLNGLLGSLTWVWTGITDLAAWGWTGLGAAAKWAREGLRDFGVWLWDGVLRGLEWTGRFLLHVLENAGVGESLQMWWGLLNKLRPLTGAEEAASTTVHPPGLIPYSLVRVDDDSVLIRIGTALSTAFGTKVKPAAITTMHIVHLPKGGGGLDTMVHELTHVAQYEMVGAVYMFEALHAQNWGAGYDYGDLEMRRKGGQHFSDMNREQQAQICEDYFVVSTGGTPRYGATLRMLTPFIVDMRRRKF